MDEQALLHQISIDTDVNIELLRDLFHDDRIYRLIMSGEHNEAIKLIRTIQPRVGLREAQLIVRAFSAEIM
jgi:hypothetical protein